MIVMCLYHITLRFGFNMIGPVYSPGNSKRHDDDGHVPAANSLDSIRPVWDMEPAISSGVPAATT